METAWLNASLPERFTVLGQQLEPFSIGHIMMLRRLGNVFAREEGGGRVTLGDLTQAVFICCHTFDEGWAAFHQANLGELLTKWGEKTDQFDFKEAVQWFREYLDHGYVLPEIKDASDKEGEKRMPGAPFLQRILLTLQSKLNYTRSEALNMPYAQALLDYFAYWEMEHAIKILNEQEIRERDEERSAEDKIWEQYKKTPEYRAFVKGSKPKPKRKGKK